MSDRLGSAPAGRSGQEESFQSLGANRSDEVKASGMTPGKFYDLVVEHNPQLVEDDYEFKKGKTYLLPECQ